MRLVAAGISALLIAFFSLALSISTRSGGSPSVHVAPPVVDQGTLQPAEPTQVENQPAPATVPPDNQVVPPQEEASRPLAMPTPPAPQPLLRSQPQLAAPAHPGKHKPKSDQQGDDSHSGD